jgi:hypothetical protein
MADAMTARSEVRRRCAERDCSEFGGGSLPLYGGEATGADGPH